MEIDKDNLELDYGNTATVDVRPSKMKKLTTGIEYPDKLNVLPHTVYKCNRSLRRSVNISDLNS